jgi:hypothetical protein
MRPKRKQVRIYNQCGHCYLPDQDSGRLFQKGLDERLYFVMNEGPQIWIGAQEEVNMRGWTVIHNGHQ